MAVSSRDRPTRLATITTEPKYWDREALDQEIERVFDICHGLSAVLQFVPVVPELVRCDRRHSSDGDVRSLRAAEQKREVD